MKLDPDMRRVLDHFAGQLPSERLWDVPLRRELTRQRSAWLGGDGPPVAAFQDLELPTRAGGVAARLYEPTGAIGLPLVLFAHGGCWITGDLDTHDALCRELAVRGQSLVLAIDYRCAPEHPFPAAFEDMDDVLAHLLRERRLGTWDGRRIAVAGDSAGGTLAAALANRYRGGQLAGQLLIYPIVDSVDDTASYGRYATGLTLSAAEMAWCWDLYCPDPVVRLDPAAAPLRQPDLVGVAAAAVVIADYDVLADEGRAYVRRLREARVPVEVIVGRHLAHGFIRMAAQIAAVPPILDRCGAFLRRSFRRRVAP